jgi:hypothetical protein
MSSPWRPFCSRNDALRSVGASRIDSSSSQRLACSSSSVSDLRMLSEGEGRSLGGRSGVVDDWRGFLCQFGIAGFLAPESAIVGIVLREGEGLSTRCPMLWQDASELTARYQGRGNPL